MYLKSDPVTGVQWSGWCLQAQGPWALKDKPNLKHLFLHIILFLLELLKVYLN